MLAYNVVWKTKLSINLIHKRFFKCILVVILTVTYGNALTVIIAVRNGMVVAILRTLRGKPGLTVTATAFSDILFP